MIEELNFSLLPNDELLTFSQRALGIYSGISSSNDTYSLFPFVTKATASYSDFGKAFEREEKNPFTKELFDNDVLRDKAFQGFRYYIISCSFSRKAGWEAAALRILKVFRKHGWGAYHFGYKAETAAITNILSELKSEYDADMALLKAGDWYTELEEGQTWFEDAQKKSVTQIPDNTLTLTETRPLLIDSLRKLLSFTELQYSQRQNDNSLAGYVKALTELITITMSTARANATRRKNDKKNGDKSTDEK